MNRILGLLILVSLARCQPQNRLAGFLDFLGNIPRFLPRPSITIERIEKDEGIEERSGRVQEDEIRLLNSISDAKNNIEYCDKTAPSNTLQEVLENISDLTIFAELVEFADVTDELYKADGVTVVAPSNQAFNKLDSEVMKKLSADKEVAKQMA